LSAGEAKVPCQEVFAGQKGALRTRQKGTKQMDMRIADLADSCSEIERLYRAGNYGAAVHLAERVVAAIEQSLGPDHPDVCTILNILAELYRSQGRYADAKALYKRLGSIH
jgi:hypothetical protein